MSRIIHFTVGVLIGVALALLVRFIAGKWSAWADRKIG